MVSKLYEIDYSIISLSPYMDELDVFSNEQKLQIIGILEGLQVSKKTIEISKIKEKIIQLIIEDSLLYSEINLTNNLFGYNFITTININVDNVLLVGTSSINLRADEKDITTKRIKENYIAEYGKTLALKNALEFFPLFGKGMNDEYYNIIKKFTKENVIIIKENESDISGFSKVKNNLNLK